MNRDQLVKTAQALVAPGKGFLAADESTPTITKRFVVYGIEIGSRNAARLSRNAFSLRGRDPAKHLRRHSLR